MVAQAGGAVAARARAGRQVKPGRSLFYRAARVVMYLFLVTWAVMTLFPFIFVVLTSFKTPIEFLGNPFGLPEIWRFKNYVTAFVQGSVATYTLNSVFVVIVSTAMAIFLSATCAFAISRFKFRLKAVVWGYVLVGFLVNSYVLLMPLMILIRKMGLYNSLWTLSLVYATLAIPFNVFFFAAYMETIPRELEEAAVMDGANMWKVFWSVIMPISKPAAFTLTTFHVLYAWSDYVIALLLLDFGHSTLPVGVATVAMGKMQQNYGAYSALLVMTSIPAILFFVALQRYVVKGVTAGAVKM
jgi:raffinose/stachyose/melibiose transport system permease protein